MRAVVGRILFDAALCSSIFSPARVLFTCFARWRCGINARKKDRFSYSLVAIRTFARSLQPLGDSSMPPTPSLALSLVACSTFVLQIPPKLSR